MIASTCSGTSSWFASVHSLDPQKSAHKQLWSSGIVSSIVRWPNFPWNFFCRISARCCGRCGTESFLVTGASISRGARPGRVLRAFENAHSGAWLPALADSWMDWSRSAVQFSQSCRSRGRAVFTSHCFHSHEQGFSGLVMHKTFVP